MCRNARKIESCNGGEILRRLCLLRMTGDLIRPGVRTGAPSPCAGKAFRAAEGVGPYGGDGGQTVVSIAESRAGQFSPCIFPLSFSKGSRRQPLRHPPCGRWRLTPPLAQGRFSPMNSAFRIPHSELRIPHSELRIMPCQSVRFRVQFNWKAIPFCKPKLY